MLKNVLRYPGGKTKALSEILEQVPEHFLEYREPFVGGGSVFLHLRQTRPDIKIWINDLNPELICFWQIAQSYLPQLVEVVRRIKERCHDGRRVYSRLANCDISKLSYFDRAVRFFVLNRITFSGLLEAGGYSEESFHHRFTLSAIARLEQLEGLLENIKITNFDYSELLSAGGNDIFSFCDPPYLTQVSSKLYGSKGTLHTSFEHERFALLIKKCRHKYLITYDDSLANHNQFSNQNIVCWELQYSMNNVQQSTASKGKELFIKNY